MAHKFDDFIILEKLLMSAKIKIGISLYRYMYNLEILHAEGLAKILSSKIKIYSKWRIYAMTSICHFLSGKGGMKSSQKSTNYEKLPKTA